MFLSLLSVNVGDYAGRSGRLWQRDMYRVHQRLWMAFPDTKRRDADPFFLGQWDGPPLPEPKPERVQAGFLFRVERDGIPRILVQSLDEPDWEYAFQNAPHLLTSDPKVREFDPSFERGQAYRFRLLANVVKPKSVVHPSGKMRKTLITGLTIHRRRRTEVVVHPDPIPDPLPKDPRERHRAMLARWDPWRNWLSAMGLDRGFRIEEDSSPMMMEAVHTVVRIPGKTSEGKNRRTHITKRYNGGLFEGVIVCTDPDRLRKAVTKGVGHAKAFGFGLLSVARC